MWTVLNHETRYLYAPHGGELSYYTDFDQQHALDVMGIHGRTFSGLSARFHISYMIDNDQPDHQNTTRVKEAGMNTGYRFNFKVTTWQSSEQFVRGRIENTGLAPAYFDVYPTVNEVRSATNLRGMLPMESRGFVVDRPAGELVLSLQGDRLVPGQAIEFEANIDVN
ncbi:MAG: hypothetical protein GY822_06645 [Deltaproteobacteria bacterium]|nr:hypothetical protein [Deltaproteobacteria bacterium]